MASIDTYFRPQRERTNEQRLSRSRSPEREQISSIRDSPPASNERQKNKEEIAAYMVRSDVILSIQEPYMQQIVNGQKTYEFRKYCLKHSVARIWFYRTAPHSSIDYVCEILPAKTRKPGDSALEEDGLGNREFNTQHKDWDGYDFAYKILSVYKLDKRVTLNDLKADHGIRSAPRGLVYAPSSLTEQVDWRTQSKLR